MVPSLSAQAIPVSSGFATPRVEISAGYNYIRANAPPLGGDDFGLNGGYVSVDYNFLNWLSATGEFTYGHADKISALGQNLTLKTYMGGPKVLLRMNRFVPYGEVLFGEAQGSDSYFPTATTFTTSASSFALSAGGGLDINLTRHFAVRAPDVQYLRTGFPNAENNQQNHLMISAGVVVKFGERGGWRSPAPIVTPQPSEIEFTCSVNASNIEPGQLMGIMGDARTTPDSKVVYSWSTNGGTVTGGGRSISIDTAGLPAGEYTVTGTAALASSPTTNQSCEVSFRVNATKAAEVAEAPHPIVPTTPAEVKKEKEFHDNVPDALFDYDSYTIRPDAQKAVEHAAAYLMAHPTINVIIAGYSDERGSAEYNLALGEKRANAARDSLTHLGVPGQRLRIVSYGKETPVCSTQDETCYQQNRRAAFALSR